jgi:NAD(P)H-hydrate epimerase
MKLVTAEEMRRLEQAASEAGLSYETMMENAGHATALAVKERITQMPGQVLVLVGPGNNGGDGLVAARYLRQWDVQVSVYIWKRNSEDDTNLERARELDIPIYRAADDPEHQQLDALVAECNVLLDALLGTGATGGLRGDLPDLLRRVQQGLDARALAREAETASPLRSMTGRRARYVSARPPVVALDMPTGLDADSGKVDEATLPADITVTFAHPKRGQFLYPGASVVGKLLVADIGMDPSLAEEIPTAIATPEAVAAMLPARPPNAHKGTFGKALVVGGSTNYVGAPRLAAEGAYRSGAGLVTVAVGQRIYPVVAAQLTEPTFLVLPDDMGAIAPGAVRVLADKLEEYDAMLLGPGMGTDTATGDFICALLTGKRTRRTMGFSPEDEVVGSARALPPLVIDADGLNLLARCPNWWEHLPPESVLTPHPGEMSRLLGHSVREVQANRLGAAQSAALEWRCTIVLKGAYTIVAAPSGRTTIIPFANAALATAGTGDVLAGAIVGLMAQGLRAYEAAVSGAYIHALAGQIRKRQWGEAGMLASDLLALLPRAMEELRN